MYYIGIDVGGTNLKAGLVNEEGVIVEVERIPLDYKDPEQFAKTVADLAWAVSKKGGVALEDVAWGGHGHARQRGRRQCPLPHQHPHGECPPGGPVPQAL